MVVTTASNVAAGTVAIRDPGPLLDGQYTYTTSLIDGAGNPSPASAGAVLSVVTVKGDYNGDGKADLAVFRRVSAGEADWYVSGGHRAAGIAARSARGRSTCRSRGTSTATARPT